MPVGGWMSRIGDVTVGLGVLAPPPKPIAGIFINTQPAATQGSLVKPHFPCSPQVPLCCKSVVAEGTPTVLLNGIPATYVKAMTICGHPIMTGAAGVIVSG